MRRGKGTKHLNSESTVLVDKASFSFLKATHRGIRPPIGHCAVLIIMASMLVETMTQFVSCYSSKAAEIKEAKIIGVFSVRVECWGLKYSGREDDLLVSKSGKMAPTSLPGGL
jgi:hypothetical protein